MRSKNIDQLLATDPNAEFASKPGRFESHVVRMRGLVKHPRQSGLYRYRELTKPGTNDWYQSQGNCLIYSRDICTVEDALAELARRAAEAEHKRQQREHEACRTRRADQLAERLAALGLPANGTTNGSVEVTDLDALKVWLDARQPGSGSPLMLEGVPVYVSGVSGHFIGAAACRLRLSWRIGNYRVSTVGGYEVCGESAQVGCDRYAETFVFRVVDTTGEPEGVITDWTPIATEAIASRATRVAEAVHYRVASIVAKVVAEGRDVVQWERFSDALAASMDAEAPNEP